MRRSFLRLSLYFLLHYTLFITLVNTHNNKATFCADCRFANSNSRLSYRPLGSNSNHIGKILLATTSTKLRERHLLPIVNSLILHAERRKYCLPLLHKTWWSKTWFSHKRCENKTLGNPKGMEETSTGNIKSEEKIFLKNALNKRCWGKLWRRIPIAGWNATPPSVVLASFQTEEVTWNSKRCRQLIEAELQQILCQNMITWAFCCVIEVLPSFTCNILKT